MSGPQSEWEPGDIALCINNDHQESVLVVGQRYTVQETFWGIQRPPLLPGTTAQGLALVLVETSPQDKPAWVPHNQWGFAHEQFRKIGGRSVKEKFIASLKGKLVRQAPVKPLVVPIV